jgi:hypothetical protein
MKAVYSFIAGAAFAGVLMSLALAPPASGGKCSCIGEALGPADHADHLAPPPPERERHPEWIGPL